MKEKEIFRRIGEVGSPEHLRDLLNQSRLILITTLGRGPFMFAPNGNPMLLLDEPRRSVDIDETKIMGFIAYDKIRELELKNKELEDKVQSFETGPEDSKSENDTLLAENVSLIDKIKKLGKPKTEGISREEKEKKKKKSLIE